MLRTFCMWLMLLALPVQGMAQASMFSCHLTGEGQGSASVADHDSMNHGSLDHGSMDHGSMSRADMGHDMQSMNASDSAQPDSGKKLLKSLHGCCNCAPSCAVVMLPVAQAHFAAVQPDVLYAVSTPQLPHSADTRRIDRPPKALAI